MDLYTPTHACPALVEAAMDLPSPVVCPVAPRDLALFCCEHGHDCCIEPSGTQLVPPNGPWLPMTTWERALRLRCVPARLC
jgi:hypothetical protein